MKRKWPLVPAAVLAVGCICYVIYGRSDAELQKMDELSERSAVQAEKLHAVLHAGEVEYVASEDLIEDSSEYTSVGPEEFDTEEIIEEDVDLGPEDETDAASASYDQANYPLPETHQIIFVGDSRTVGAGKAESKQNDTCIYIGESGEGYTWFEETGVFQMEEAIELYPDAQVVYNLGVNDCDAAESYIALYRELESVYPDTSFYYMSVNPVTEESAHVTDSDITAFNSLLESAFPDQYIDTYSWMVTGGFVSVDGVHYSSAQYCAIHDYAVRAIYGLPQPTEGVTDAPTEGESESF